MIRIDQILQLMSRHSFRNLCQLRCYHILMHGASYKYNVLVIHHIVSIREESQKFTIELLSSHIYFSSYKYNVLVIHHIVSIREESQKFTIELLSSHIYFST